MATTRYVEGMAYEYMKEHGLIADGWSIMWNGRKTAMGVTNYQRKTISFSRLLMPAVSDVTARNTILHEIAHALTEGHGHNSVWRRKFISIGGDGKRSTSAVPREHVLSLRKYKVYCAGGSFLGTANKKTKSLTSKVCKCHHKGLVFLPNN